MWESKGRGAAAAAHRFPFWPWPLRRPRRPSCASRPGHLGPGESRVGQALADHAGRRAEEAHAVGHLAVVEPEGLLIQVAEEVERLDADVGSFDRALEERPEVFQIVGVDLALGVAFGMVDDLVDIVLAEFVVGRQRIVNSSDPSATCSRTAGARVLLRVLGTTLAVTLLCPSSPCRSSSPMTATLPMPPVPVIFSARFPLCMNRALPPMKVASTSTSPESLPNPPLWIASRSRWPMNQAPRALTLRARANS